MENKNKIRFILIFLGLLLIYFIQRGCEPTVEKTTTQKVVIPEKKGDFTEKPTLIENTKKDSVIYKNKKIYLENPVNKKLAEDFIRTQKENDSLKALKLYLDAIQEKDGTYVFNNSDLKLEVRTVTRGEILSINPTYTIKESKVDVEVKQKETVFAVYAGGGLTTTTTLNKLTPQATVGIQNKKGDLYFTSAGADGTVQVGFIHRFINIKK